MADIEFESRVELPRGHWVELRNPYDVSERERRPLKKAFLELGQAGSKARGAPGEAVVATPLPPQLGGSDASPAADMDIDLQLDALETYEAESMAFFVESWSFDAAPTADAMGDLPAAAYAALQEEVGARLEVLFPNLVKKDEANPTTP